VQRRAALPPRLTPAARRARGRLRQKFVAHKDETDPARVALILSRSRTDAAWVLNKYAGKRT
jgi:hypothetical protein